MEENSYAGLLLGSTEIEAIFIGDIEIESAYLGSDLIFSE